MIGNTNLDSGRFRIRAEWGEGKGERKEELKVIKVHEHS